MFTASKTGEKLTGKEKRSMMTNFDGRKAVIPWDSIPRDETLDKFQGFSIGFALKNRKPNTKYNENQVSYLKQVFLEGESGGKKYIALETVELMKRAKNVGNLQEFWFSVSEWLTEPQIKYHIANFGTQLRKNGKIDSDVAASRAEIHEMMEENEVRFERRDAAEIYAQLSQQKYVVDPANPQEHPWIVRFLSTKNFDFF